MQVVLVEDDAFIREDLRLELTGAGHSVTDHDGGKGALRSIMLDPPDILVTDIVMEDGEGMDLITTVRQVCPSTMIIAISSRAKYLTYAAALGAHHTITKPFKPQLLLQIIGSQNVSVPKGLSHLT